MIEALTRRWWLFLIRGLAAVVFGILALIWPGIALGALTIVFGAYAFVDGVFAFAAAVSGTAGSRWWVFMIEGIVGLIVAFFVLTEPVLSAISLVYVVAIWAIVTGAVEIVAGVQLRDMISNEWLYVLAGIVSIAFGILVLRDPSSGALAVVWLIAYYAILFGILQLAFSYRLNRLGAVPSQIQRTA
ncbi:MAG: HdeD family acid-resistance protein [Vulcanimicrobiaceae bacterium]|jgi:uncharacterized membrane protein HdeD (DUF308 family)